MGNLYSKSLQFRSCPTEGAFSVDARADKGSCVRADVCVRISGQQRTWVYSLPVWVYWLLKLSMKPEQGSDSNWMHGQVYYSGFSKVENIRETRLFIGCSPGNPAMTFLHWKGQEHRYFFSPQGWMSHSPNMESWRISGETVASAYIGIPKKLVLTLAKKCSNRIDGVTKGNEARQPKSKVSFFHVF